jgi:polyphosphate glucokinase
VVAKSAITQSWGALKRYYDSSMVLGSIPVDEQIFAIDIGATNIKFCHVDVEGQLLEAVRRSSTPYPCNPTRLVEILSLRINKSDVSYVGVGFPGELANGLVTDPGNLARPGGVTTDIDPQLDDAWRGFALEESLRASTGRDVRVVNDATLAALGCCQGTGTELVLALGTGFGLALEVDGELQKVRDVGAEIFVNGKTYDEVLGEQGRSQDEVRWRSLLGKAVAAFAHEFHATTVHLAGGNARRLSPNSLPEVTALLVVHGNEAPLHGVAKLFYI